VTNNIVKLILTPQPIQISVSFSDFSDLGAFFQPLFCLITPCYLHFLFLLRAHSLVGSL